MRCYMRLEQELCVSLFTRTANRIALNERGKAFYIEARRALEILAPAFVQVFYSMLKEAF